MPLTDAVIQEKILRNGSKISSVAGVVMAKRNELHTFAAIPKRWRERTPAWLEKVSAVVKETYRQSFLSSTCFYRVAIEKI